jgi:hypothetical protein
MLQYRNIIQKYQIYPCFHKNTEDSFYYRIRGMVEGSDIVLAEIVIRNDGALRIDYVKEDYRDAEPFVNHVADVLSIQIKYHHHNPQIFLMKTQQLCQKINLDGLLEVKNDVPIDSDLLHKYCSAETENKMTVIMDMGDLKKHFVEINNVAIELMNFYGDSSYVSDQIMLNHQTYDLQSAIQQWETRISNNPIKLQTLKNNVIIVRYRNFRPDMIISSLGTFGISYKFLSAEKDDTNFKARMNMVELKHNDSLKYQYFLITQDQQLELNYFLRTDPINNESVNKLWNLARTSQRYRASSDADLRFASLTSG